MVLKPKAEKIKRLLIEQGLGTLACSEETGISYPTIVGLTRGRKCIPRTARAFCDYFAIDIWEYFELLD